MVFVRGVDGGTVAGTPELFFVGDGFEGTLLGVTCVFTGDDEGGCDIGTGTAAWLQPPNRTANRTTPAITRVIIFLTV